MRETKIKVIVVDDHVAFRNELATLIGGFKEFTVLCQADNGNQLIEQLEAGALPEIILLDINMPGMNGYDTAFWLKTYYPQIKVLALSMNDNPKAISRMLENGTRGFLLKDSEPGQLKTILMALAQKD
jgi:two-component system invasion response regulator UvrY